MNSKPLVGANMSQMTFKKEEQLIEPKPNNMFSNAYNNLSALSDINTEPELYSEMSSIIPAYLSQAKMSTYYQNNPWKVLTYSEKYGNTEIMGGKINSNLPPGYRPGNTYKNQ